MSIIKSKAFNHKIISLYFLPKIGLSCNNGIITDYKTFALWIDTRQVIILWYLLSLLIFLKINLLSNPL